MGVDSLKNNNLSSDKISNILTLRYDPNNQSTLKPINWKDFLPKKNVDKILIKDNLQKSIKKNLISKSNLSIALSGGVDSTLLLSLTKEILPDIPITAITITFPHSEDESISASNIAQNFDIDHKIIHIENFLKELPAAIGILKEPYWDVMNWYYLVKNSKSISNSLLTGDGADEIFGGYTFRYSKFLNSINNNSSPIEKAQMYLECHERDWVPDQENLFDKKSKFSWNKINNILKPFFDNSLSLLDQVFLADLNGKLKNNFIPNYEKFYNFFKISPISPFLDKSVIKEGLHMSPEEKYDFSNNIGKLPLRKLIPQNVNSLLFPKLKQGFAVNTISLWDNYGKEICKQYLFDARIVKDGWISNEWIKKNFQKADSEKNIRYINKFFSILGYEIWYRLFITKEMSSSETL